MHFFEELEIGRRREIGSFTFTAENIKKFAAQFDPQRFHLDEEEGRKSLFGGLAAPQRGIVQAPSQLGGEGCAIGLAKLRRGRDVEVRELAQIGDAALLQQQGRLMDGRCFSTSEESAD